MNNDLDIFGQMLPTYARHRMLPCERVDHRIYTKRLFVSRIADQLPHPRRCVFLKLRCFRLPSLASVLLFE